MLKKYYVVLLVSVSLFLVSCDNLDPEEIRQRQHFPGKNFVADAQQGRALFVANCSQCHGPAGHGTGQGPPLVDKIYRAAHHADITFHWAVKNGVKQHHWGFGDMPPIGNVSPEDVGHIIAYIRQQQRNAGIQ
ncbi:MAG TPA: cytochrome c [Gammaproteobacteria bacterium]|nr:cytochrome c [Gammaproteobacteria bacterium]